MKIAMIRKKLRILKTMNKRWLLMSICL